LNADTISQMSRTSGTGMLQGVVRTRALLALQSAEARERIHIEFARLLEPYRTGGGFHIPLRIKLASARKA
jgi:hypothetical protein